jgi:TonB family protein
VLGAIFGAALSCAPAQLFAQTQAAPPAQPPQSSQTPPAPPAVSTQPPVLAGAPHARVTAVPGIPAQAAAPTAQTPRQNPFPESSAAPPAPTVSLWAAPVAGHAFAASPRRNTTAIENKAGTLTTREGLRLRLDTETGNVRVFTDATNEVRYVVRIETDASGPDAQKLIHQFDLYTSSVPAGVTISGKIPGREQRERVWVTYELHVPRKYNVDVTTHAGNIQVDDVDGRVNLVTDGGNIAAGRVTGGGVRQPGVLAARLESISGGHISVRDVTGDLKAITAGGHITAGNISGDANLSTGGGHITAGNIHGVAQLDTGGGNISVERAGSRVTASSGGGQISFGEAAGAIQARAAGGGIRVLRVSGPMQLDSNGGSIFLTKVENAVHASTGTGSITAWLSPTVKIAGSSQLESGHGDIVVYVPRDLQMTIEATIDTAAGHHIAADPSLAMKTTYHTGDSGKQVRGVCDINGGGEVLKLRAMEGNIQLRYLDDAVFQHTQELVEQQVRQEFENAQKNFQIFMLQNMQDMQKLQQNWAQNASGQAIVLMPAQPANAPNAPPMIVSTTRPPAAPAPAQPPPAQSDGLWIRLGEYWWGGVRVDTVDQEARRVKEVKPVYPDIARQAGIEGIVSMRVVINKDGAVEKVEVLSGEQALRQAAETAVRQWRYRPLIMDGNAVPVVTIVNMKFQIQ